MCALKKLRFWPCSRVFFSTGSQGVCFSQSSKARTSWWVFGQRGILCSLRNVKQPPQGETDAHNAALQPNRLWATQAGAAFLFLPESQAHMLIERVSSNDLILKL